MFNFQGSELIIILLLALVVLGPEKLPEAMRQMGKFYGELRKMSSSFQDEFRSAVDEPVREMRETADLIRDSADFTKLADGERAEKPKSGEMPTVGSPEMVGDAPDDDPVDELPFQRGGHTDAGDAGRDGTDDGADTADGDAAEDTPTRARGADTVTPVVAPPPPFAASGAAHPEPADDDPARDDHGTGERDA